MTTGYFDCSLSILNIRTLQTSIIALYLVYMVQLYLNNYVTFSGIVMEPGKKYSTIVENTFHLSMATLDLKTVAKGTYVMNKLYFVHVLLY